MSEPVPPPPPAQAPGAPVLRLNELGYLEMPGLNVMLAQDYYPEGHQAGVSIIQNGQRVATNGDLRLDRTPGQWQPVPRPGERKVDRGREQVSVRLEFPDPARDRIGFNPIAYPDLRLAYEVSIRPEGRAFRIRVDLEAPLPAAWVGRVGLNLELYPGILFGRAYRLDGRHGIFPRQPGGPGSLDAAGEVHLAPLATGRRLAVAPESDRQCMIIEALSPGDLELLDGRGQHSNGWFVVRSPVPAGATAGAVEWRVTPAALPDFVAEPVVQLSQVGYHPRQPKVAVIQADASDARRPAAVLARVTEGGRVEPVLAAPPREWGRFLRYRCFQFDFSAVEAPGLYVVQYGQARSPAFPIGPEVYRRGVWQPTLEYFLPVQMCHVRVNDRYRVWHGACHLDDARMAPIDHVHFDGYAQGAGTLCGAAPGQPVPGLDRGGWHDAGDFDLRVESQLETIWGLALAREAFGVDHDGTTIDQERRVVEIGRPDGKPDILQQIEHGLLSVLGGYRALGRLYRGVVEPTLRQYVLLGDPVNATDNRVGPPALHGGAAPAAAPDDRWVFTEQHPDREIQAAAGLAAAARVLPGFDDALGAECLAVARALWAGTRGDDPAARTAAAVELLLTTGERGFAEWLVEHRGAIAAAIGRTGWLVARVLRQVDDPRLTGAVTEALRGYREDVRRLEQQTPYGVPYTPDVWGDGWAVQAFGRRHYFLHLAFPELFPATPLYQALGFVLGCHPGDGAASLVSGVGARSMTTAYGLNRADGSYVPGGVMSGAALIRPDFVELLDWPYLWQQTEYCLGASTTDFLFLVLAADQLLSKA